MITALADAGRGARPRRLRRRRPRRGGVRARAPARRRTGACCGRTTPAQAKLGAYLEDHAFLLEALLVLYEATFEPRWFAEARALADVLVERFADAEHGGFFSTSADDEPLVARRKDLEDAPDPGGRRRRRRSGSCGWPRSAARPRYEEHAVGQLRLLRRARAAAPDGLRAPAAGAGPAPAPRPRGRRWSAPTTAPAALAAVVREGLRPQRRARRAGPGERPCRCCEARAPVDGRAAAYVCRALRLPAPGDRARPPARRARREAVARHVSGDVTRCVTVDGMTRLLALPAGRRAKWVIFAVWLVVAVRLARPRTCPGSSPTTSATSRRRSCPATPSRPRRWRVTKQLQGGENVAAVVVYRRDGGPDRRRPGAHPGRHRPPGPAQAGTRSSSGSPTSVLPPHGLARPAPPRSWSATIRGERRGRARSSTRWTTSATLVSERTAARPAGQGHRRRRLLAPTRSRSSRASTGRCCSAAVLLVLFLLIIIYRSPIFWLIPMLAVLVGRAAARARSATG